MFDELWLADTNKMSVASLPAGHSFVVFVAATLVTPYNLYSVHKSLNSCHDVSILVTDANYHDTGNSFSIFILPAIGHVS